MRNIILFMHISLDGIVAGPKGSLDWANRGDAEVGRFMVPDLLKTTDAMLSGRVLYEGFQQFWPAAARNPNMPPDLLEFARWIDAAPKYVVSRKPRPLSWQNSKPIIATDDATLVAAIKKLKRSKGRDIVIFGGARLAQALTRLDLIDEYRFKLETAVVGGGVPLFKKLPAGRKFKQTLVKTFESGVTCLYYVPVRG